MNKGKEKKIGDSLKLLVDIVKWGLWLKPRTCNVCSSILVRSKMHVYEHVRVHACTHTHTQTHTNETKQVVQELEA